jgi:hypothetical protein
MLSLSKQQLHSFQNCGGGSLVFKFMALSHFECTRAKFSHHIIPGQAVKQ